jgi:hypothetical protein
MIDEKMCFAYVEDKCSALKILECENCIFFKTKEQAYKDQQKVFARIKILDPKVRANIISLYYRGNMKLLDEVEVRK